MAATMTQVINLALEVGILLMAGLGYYFFRARKYHWHAQLMTIGFAMIVVSFLLVMLPSLLMTYMTFLDPATVVFDTASLLHIPLGILGMALGAFLVIRWAQNDYRLNDMKAAWTMRATMVTWVANVLLGAAIFFTMPS